MVELSIAAVTATMICVVVPEASIAAASLAWILFGLAFYDLAHGRLPDVLTALLCVLGLSWSLFGVMPISLTDSIIGAVIGAFIPLLVASAYRVLSGQSGLGGGDIKLFSAVGAWIGWQALPVLLLLASTSALVAVAVRGKSSWRERIPFGPFIALSTAVIWCWQGRW